MILGKWNVRNYWFKPDERKRMTRIVKRLLANGWELTDVTYDGIGEFYGNEKSYYPGHEEFQIQILNGHNKI